MRDELERRTWSDITMSDVAGAAGVSRQTLYKEFGSRDEFAQAFVLQVGERFLDQVDAAVREHLDDPRAAIGAALETFLRSAGEDPVVRVLLSDDGTGGMLPFVTTQGMPVVVFATAKLFQTISEGWPTAPSGEGPAARRVAGPPGDQLHHRALGPSPTGPPLRRASCWARSSIAPSASPPEARMTTYDRTGQGYAAVRQGDPRIAARVEAALGDARSVLNVGAGTGSYEPADREVTAVEPSAVMISQRAPGTAPVVQASAEDLPFEDDSFDAAMAMVTVHHWQDLAAGVEEMRRVARRRVVVLSFDPAPLADFWLVEYFPRAFEIHSEFMPPLDELAALMGGASVEVVPMPRRCSRRLLLRALGQARDAPRPRGAAGEHDLARDGARGDRARPGGAARPTSRAAAGTSATATCARRPPSSS